MTDVIEQRLRDVALRPGDEEFTRRVLEALPPQGSMWRARVARSFDLATRGGLALLLIAFALHWFLAASDGPGSLPEVLLFFVPVLAAVTQLCGPLVPGSVMRLLRRAAGRRYRGGIGVGRVAPL